MTNTRTLDGFIQNAFDRGNTPNEILKAFENYINAEIQRRKKFD